MIKKGLENQRKNLQQLELKNEKILKEISKIKRLKKAKGITLIALIITIIILIILAGITLVALSGENGILRQASKAKEETRAGAVEEVKDLWKINKNIDNQTEDATAQTLDELLADLERQGLLTAEEVATVKETGKVTIGERTIEFESSAMTLVEMYKNAENCEVTDGTCSDETHLHIGDYVEYTPGNNEAVTVGKFDTGYDEEQTYSVDKTTTWRVLGLSEEGNILLTSGSPIKKDGEDPYLYLQGAEGYINCVNTLNKVCGVYNNPDLAEETRSITIEDINRIGGIVVENNKVYKKDNPDTNIDISGLLGKEDSYSYKAGDYAPENYMNDVYGTNATRKSAGGEVNSDAYGYVYESLGANERVYNMLFSEATSTDKYAKAYWLASPGCIVVSHEAFFSPGFVCRRFVCRGATYLFGSEGGWYASRMAVRPVVSLKSEITIEDVAKSENQTDREVSWKDAYDNSNLGESSGSISDNKGLVD